MPWKVKKRRRIGPFWVESSRDRTEPADLSTGRAHPGHTPMFGGPRATTPAPDRETRPIFGPERLAELQRLEPQRPLRVVPPPVPPASANRPDLQVVDGAEAGPPPSASWGA